MAKVAADYDGSFAEAGRSLLFKEFGHYYGHPDVVFAIEKDHSVVGAVAFHSFNGHDIEVTVAGRNCWSRGVWQTLADYAFNQAGCARVTIHCRRSNVQTQRLAMKFGFVFEGIKRRFYGEEDAAMFGLLRSECRWLRIPPRHATLDIGNRGKVETASESD